MFLKKQIKFKKLSSKRSITTKKRTIIEACGDFISIMNNCLKKYKILLQKIWKLSNEFTTYKITMKHRYCQNYWVFLNSILIVLKWLNISRHYKNAKLKQNYPNHNKHILATFQIYKTIKSKINRHYQIHLLKMTKQWLHNKWCWILNTSKILLPRRESVRKLGKSTWDVQLRKLIDLLFVLMISVKRFMEVKGVLIFISKLNTMEATKQIERSLRCHS